MGLITITEANASLNDEVYPDWDALEDSFKQVYIDRASAWVQRNWIDEATVNFDWGDDTTWDDEASTKDLIAQYSDMVRSGELYNQGGSDAPIKRKTNKAGSLEQTIEYHTSSASGGVSLLPQINDQMIVLGYTRIYANGSLTRV